MIVEGMSGIASVTAAEGIDVAWMDAVCHPRMRTWAVWLLSALLCLTVAGCTDMGPGGSGSASDAERLGLAQSEVQRLRHTALEVAGNEKYEIRNMEFRLVRDGENYKGLFTPRAKNALGGELHVIMDRHGRVVRVYRGA
jgi:hypothetical protein